jgi:hypothetical protein
MELFKGGHPDQCHALLLRIEAANWLWWLNAKQVANRTTAQGS